MYRRMEVIDQIAGGLSVSGIQIVRDWNDTCHVCRCYYPVAED